MLFRSLLNEFHSSALSRVRGVFYGWWMVCLTAFLLTIMALGVFQGLGTMVAVLERRFGWSRTALSGAFAFSRVQGAIVGPMEGILVDRLGSRRMVLVGYVIMGVGFVLMSQVESLWQFYVTFIVISLGSSLGGWLAMITVVNNWFARQRSIAQAAATSGIHLGGFLVPVLALGLEYHGFSWTTLGIGVFLLAIVGPAASVVRNRPEDYGMLPDGDPPRSTDSTVEKDAAPTGDSDADFTVAQALRTPAFWIIAIVNLSSTVSIVTLAIHLVPKLTDMGMPLVSAGVVVLTYTAVAFPSQFIAGYVADRLSMPPVIFVFLMLQAVAIMIIAVADSVQMAYLFAVLYGIGFGGRIPLLTAIWGNYFGRRSFATIMGLSQFPSNLAMIAGPLFAGYMFDTRQSYFIPFTTFAVLTFLGAWLMVFVRKPQLRSTVSPRVPP